LAKPWEGFQVLLVILIYYIFTYKCVSLFL
jgi:hypothetical protein